MEALSAEKWSLYLDNEGKVFDEYTIRKIAFHKANNFTDSVAAMA